MLGAWRPASRCPGLESVPLRTNLPLTFAFAFLPPPGGGQRARGFSAHLRRVGRSLRGLPHAPGWYDPHQPHACVTPNAVVSGRKALCAARDA